MSPRPRPNSHVSDIMSTGCVCLFHSRVTGNQGLSRGSYFYGSFLADFGRPKNTKNTKSAAGSSSNSGQRSSPSNTSARRTALQSSFPLPRIPRKGPARALIAIWMCSGKTCQASQIRDSSGSISMALVQAGVKADCEPSSKSLFLQSLSGLFAGFLIRRSQVRILPGVLPSEPLKRLNSGV